MAWRRSLAVFFCVCLLGEGFAAPAQMKFQRGRRADAVAEDNEVTSKELTVAEDRSDTTTTTTTTTSPITSAVASSTEEFGLSDPETSPPSSPPEFNRSDSEASPSVSPSSRSEFGLSESESSSPPSSPSSSPPPDDDDDDDDDFADLPPSTSGGGGGGSNLFSLLNLAGALFPGSSGSNAKIRDMIEKFIIKYEHMLTPILPRKDNNKVTIDYDLKPPKAPKPTKLNIGKLKVPKFTNVSTPLKFAKANKPVKMIKPVRQEIDESSSNESDGSNELSEENDASEDSVEDNGDGNSNGAQQESDGDNSEDYDSDEPPGGGDGQGGGLLGLLAGLSGGEDGQSDLGSLLATVGGIVANLSGDGFDLNSLVATALGLFVGLLSDGTENPGAVVAKYLLTSLETITEGGAQNNGAFFGRFISTLVKGTSAVPPGSDEDEDVMKMPMADSAGFLASFISGLLGDMSKGSSSGGWR